MPKTLVSRILAAIALAVPFGVYMLVAHGWAWALLYVVAATVAVLAVRSVYERYDAAPR